MCILNNINNNNNNNNSNIKTNNNNNNTNAQISWRLGKPGTIPFYVISCKYGIVDKCIICCTCMIFCYVCG